jgi:hypothetical protein
MVHSLTAVSILSLISPQRLEHREPDVSQLGDAAQPRDSRVSGGRGLASPTENWKAGIVTALRRAGSNGSPCTSHAPFTRVASLAYR